MLFCLCSGNMALEKHLPASNLTVNVKPLSFPLKIRDKAALVDPEMSPDLESDVDVDLREIYFLIMHFLSVGPCQRTCGQFWNELLEHDLLPRRYHAWYSRSGGPSGDENDNGLSFPLSYNKLVERYVIYIFLIGASNISLGDHHIADDLSAQILLQPYYPL